MTTLIIPLPPPPTNRPRIVVAPRLQRPMLAKPKKLARWLKQAAPHVSKAAPKLPYVRAVAVAVMVVHPRPQRLNRRKDPPGLLWCTAATDVDNAAKVVLDLMTECGWWTDDNLVAQLLVTKFYAETDGPGPRIEVSVERIEDGRSWYGAEYETDRCLYVAEPPATQRKRLANREEQTLF